MGGSRAEHLVEEVITMETIGQREHLSRDLPCLECGHGAHRYLPCSDTCTCHGVVMPGAA